MYLCTIICPIRRTLFCFLCGQHAHSYWISIFLLVLLFCWLQNAGIMNNTKWFVSLLTKLILLAWYCWFDMFCCWRIEILQFSKYAISSLILFSVDQLRNLLSKSRSRSRSKLIAHTLKHSSIYISQLHLDYLLITCWLYDNYFCIYNFALLN